MTSFLTKILQELLKEHQSLSSFVFVLPSKRAGAFLQREISRLIKKPVFAPKVISIEEFAEQVSGLQTIDTTTTLFEFYSIYKDSAPAEEAEEFETFSTWAQTLIHDFNEIDRFLIPSGKIFNYLSEIQDINHWSLQPEKTNLVKNYLAFWKKLPFYYTNLQEKLLNDKKAYQGLVYRQAANNIAHFAPTNGADHVFVGFNALNKAEQSFIQEMLNNGSRIFWDIDESHFEKPGHDASLFIRDYVKNWPYYKENNFEFISRDYASQKNIEITGVPKNIGQAKYVGEILSRLSTEELNSTAVVLGDETLLLPVLNSAPPNVESINVTMGYPLRLSPFAPLFEKFFDLFKIVNNKFYYKDILSLLNHKVMSKAIGKRASKVTEKIRKENLLYLSSGQIVGLFGKENEKLTELCFPERKITPQEALNNFRGIIKILKESIEDEETLFMEFLYSYNVIFDELRKLLNSYPHITGISSLYHFFREISSQQSLDFRGRPFQGLQLMGMLESRVLDFETVILTSVNEGILPGGKSNNSFIPYDLKKAYDLPTYKEKDAVYTYHFYHLLQRAKKVHLLYNSDTESQMGGEKSRFLIQLEIENHPNHNIKRSVVIPEVPVTVNKLQEVEKSPEILARIEALAEKGFSPSSLTTYMRNPIDFYKQYILKIRDKEEVEETVAYNTLGTVVHETLEAFYTPLKGKFLTAEDLKDFKKRTPEEVTKQFEKNYSRIPLNRGKNLLIFEVVKRYVINFLKMEEKELEKGIQAGIKEIEAGLTAPLQIGELDFPVNIRGNVDRVDMVDGVLRIIDYKTGKVAQNQLEIVDWDEITTDYDKFSKPFQVLMYATMLLHNTPVKGPVEAGVISFKNLKGGFLKFGQKETSRGKKKNCRIEEETIENFKEQLKKLIVEICDPKIPFLEKEIKKGYGN